jgi:hypothetical protein
MLLPKSLRPFVNMVDSIYDERRDGNGYFVYLKKGYCEILTQGNHTLVGQTIKELVRDLKMVEQCKCCDCSKV